MYPAPKGMEAWMSQEAAASNNKTGALPPKSREVRLGLVMYGGVSLEIGRAHV